MLIKTMLNKLMMKKNVTKIEPNDANGEAQVDLKSANKNSNAEQPLVGHLIELRGRVIKALASIFIIFLALVGFANPIFSYLASPLISALPQGGELISTGFIAPFFVPIKLVFILSFYISIPWILYQAWGFIGPGLYKNEQKVVFPIIFSSAFLFYLGMAFAFYVVLPIMSKFLVGTTPFGVEMKPDIKDYLSTVLNLFFIFGLAFEVPIVVIILVTAGVMSAAVIAAKRRYIILMAFILAAIVTPPDPLSQVLFACAGILLFEIGLFIAKLIEKRSL
ncbi:TatABCE protein translocation system subunit TatC [Gammaproteobacteria bacterium]|nr:TatABCE protein translocation system subunit TatC [Gammaproteobacteria bacterium]